MTIQGYGHVFARNPLDKGEKERRNESEINNMMANPQSRFLPLRELNLLVNTGPESNLFWLSRVQLDAFGYESEPIFLGILNDVYHFAVEVSIDRFSDAVIRNLKPSLRFIDVRSCGEFLDRSSKNTSLLAPTVQVLFGLRIKNSNEESWPSTKLYRMRHRSFSKNRSGHNSRGPQWGYVFIRAIKRKTSKN